MQDISISVPFPLDNEGFLRRQCPTCERKFKWRHTAPDEEATPEPVGGYFCPYCGVQALQDAWFTDLQSGLIQAALHNDAVVPLLRDFQRSLESLNSSSSLVRVTTSAPEELDKPTLVEVDDMKRIDFPCHTEPVKVLDEWEGPVHCLVCGEPR